MAKFLLLILGLSQYLNDHGSPGERLREPCAEGMGTLLRTHSERRWQPRLDEPLGAASQLSHIPHRTLVDFIFLFLSQQKAFYLFTYLFYLFFKVGVGGGWICL